MGPLSLFGSGVQSYSAVATAQRRLNCFFDPRSDEDKSASILRGTPGSRLWLTLPKSPVRGFWVVGTVLYAVAGNTLYGVTATGAYTALGTLSTSYGRVEMQDNGVQLIVVDGTAGYILTFAGSVFITITDVNFPNGCTTVAFINGRFVVETANTRIFVISALYAGQTWTPYTFGVKENESSNLLAVEVLNSNLILWGKASIEFWQDIGSTPNPYQRINGATQSWGLGAVASRVKFMNTEIFLGVNPQGSVQILMLNGYTPDRVSTSDIENIINAFTTVSDAVALSYVVDGHTMYQITFPAGGRSFLYDGLTKLWSEVQTGVDLVARHEAQYGVSFNSKDYYCDSSTGILYLLDSNVFTDNGTAIKRQVRTRHVTNKGNVFTVAELYLDIETGIGLQSGQGSDPMMMVQVSKDGGRTFGVERQVSMGLIGQYRSPRLITRRWGSSRDFVWQFTVTDPVKFLIVGGAASVA